MVSFIRVGALLCLGLLPSVQLAVAADKSDELDGQLVYNNHCRTCHSTDAKDNRLGPNLHGILGRKAGSVKGFRYSPALEQSDIVWDRDNLDKFIADPESVIRGNKMQPYGGITDAKRRAAIITFFEKNAPK